MCSETSPRVSFSHDLIIQPTIEQQRRDTMLLEPCSDFEFNICCSFEQQYSTADELFANGMILPVHLQEKKVVQKCDVSLPPRPKSSSTVDDSSKDFEEKPQQSKSFWSFKRSSSLNCDIKKKLICSLPLLSRSNSTGTVPKPNRSSSVKDGHTHKHSSQKLSSSSSSSCCSSSSCNAYQFPQKPPLKKNNGNYYSYGNGVRISPILNVPPPYISKGTANLFGLGSLLRNGKVKKGRK